jgi:integrase/recombinase XerC
VKASIAIGDGGVRPPDSRTIDNRLWAADAFFFALRQLDCYEGHPLLDIEHPARPKGHCRPLSESEVDLGRRFARRDLRDTRGPAAWAVVEAGASTGELMGVTVADVTARCRQCWLAGDHRRLASFVELTPSGLVAVEARVQALGADPDRLLVYEGAGSAESQQAAASKVIGDALRRSGLARDAAVKPSSLRAFAGLSAYHRTGDITAAAAVLGCRSLDDAATIIGWEPDEAPEPPAHRVRP